MIPLPMRLKKAVGNAFRDNSLLTALSPQEREQAAQWYENFVDQAGGTRVDLARLYNLERAKFLRGQVARIARHAPTFAEEIGLQRTGDEA